MAKFRRSGGPAGPRLRAALRARLAGLRDLVLELHGQDGLELMGRAYGLDRLALLDADEPVTVTLYEVLSAAQRRGIDPLTVATLDADDRLTSATSVGAVAVGGCG